MCYSEIPKNTQKAAYIYPKFNGAVISLPSTLPFIPKDGEAGFKLIGTDIGQYGLNDLFSHDKFDFENYDEYLKFMQNHQDINSFLEDTQNLVKDFDHIVAE
jgi:hypothetical protein